jgi:hypothetical protein
MTRDDVPASGGRDDASGRWDAMGCMWWWWIVIVILVVMVTWWFFAQGRIRTNTPGPIPTSRPATPGYHAPNSAPAAGLTLPRIAPSWS